MRQPVKLLVQDAKGPIPHWLGGILLHVPSAADAVFATEAAQTLKFCPLDSALFP